MRPGVQVAKPAGGGRGHVGAVVQICRTSNTCREKRGDRLFVQGHRFLVGR